MALFLLRSRFRSAFLRVLDHPIRCYADVNGVMEMLRSLTYETYATTQDDTPSDGGRGRVRGWYMALKGRLPYDPQNRVK